MSVKVVLLFALIAMAYGFPKPLKSHEFALGEADHVEQVVNIEPPMDDGPSAHLRQKRGRVCAVGQGYDPVDGKLKTIMHCI